MKHLRAGLLLAALLTPAAAIADYPFILPSSTSLSGNDPIVTFDAAGSDHVFFFDHRPVQLASIKAWRPDGTAAEPTNAIQGRFRSVFDLKLDQQGTWKVASEQVMLGGTYKLNGEERRVGGRGPSGPGGPGGPGRPSNGERRGGDAPREDASGGDGARRQQPMGVQDIPAEATDLHLIETIRTTATFVTVGAPSTTAFNPTGKGLEFEPITHPNALAMGETGRFRFLIDGKPAAGLKVTAVPGGGRYREESGAITVSTGKDGIVAIKWPAAGMYWLGVDAEDRNPTEKKAETRRMSYAVTLEVMTP